MPYIVTSSQHMDNVGRDLYTFYVSPPWRILHQAVNDVLAYYGWRQAAILHSDDRGDSGWWGGGGGIGSEGREVWRNGEKRGTGNVRHMKHTYCRK